MAVQTILLVDVLLTENSLSFPGNHSIDFEEFVNFYQANFEIPTDVVMRSFFRSFDINGDGVLSKIELKEALKKMRAPMNEDIIDLMFAGVDMNRDGTISYEGKRTDTFSKLL